MERSKWPSSGHSRSLNLPAHLCDKPDSRPQTPPLPLVAAGSRSSTRTPGSTRVPVTVAQGMAAAAVVALDSRVMAAADMADTVPEPVDEAAAGCWL